MALEFLSPLHKASRQITVFLEAHLRRLGVSPVEGHVLSYLHTYAPAPVGELARVFGLKQSTLTSLLHRLERAGLLRREVNGSDRRSLLVHITDAGRALSFELNALLQALEAEIRAHCTPRDVAGFHAVARVIGEATDVRLRER